MPKTKKRSYAKIRQQRNEAKRSVRAAETDTQKTDETANVNLPPIIEIQDDSNESVDVEEILRRNRALVSACIMDVTQELKDTCIDAFLKVLANDPTTTFEPQDPLFYQRLRWYRRVTSN